MSAAGNAADPFVYHSSAAENAAEERGNYSGVPGVRRRLSELRPEEVRARSAATATATATATAAPAPGETKFYVEENSEILKKLSTLDSISPDDAALSTQIVAGMFDMIMTRVGMLERSGVSNPKAKFLACLHPVIKAMRFPIDPATKDAHLLEELRGRRELDQMLSKFKQDMIEEQDMIRKNKISDARARQLRKVQQVVDALRRDPDYKTPQELKGEFKQLVDGLLNSQVLDVIAAYRKMAVACAEPEDLETKRAAELGAAAGGSRRVRQRGGAGAGVDVLPTVNAAEAAARAAGFTEAPKNKEEADALFKALNRALNLHLKPAELNLIENKLYPGQVGGGGAGAGGGAGGRAGGGVSFAGFLARFLGFVAAVRGAGFDDDEDDSVAFDASQYMPGWLGGATAPTPTPTPASPSAVTTASVFPPSAIATATPSVTVSPSSLASWAATATASPNAAATAVATTSAYPVSATATAEPLTFANAAKTVAASGAPRVARAAAVSEPIRYHTSVSSTPGVVMVTPGPASAGDDSALVVVTPTPYPTPTPTPSPTPIPTPESLNARGATVYSGSATKEELSEETVMAARSAVRMNARSGVVNSFLSLYDGGNRVVALPNTIQIRDDLGFLASISPILQRGNEMMLREQKLSDFVSYTAVNNALTNALTGSAVPEFVSASASDWTGSTTDIAGSITKFISEGAAKLAATSVSTGPGFGKLATARSPRDPLDIKQIIIDSILRTKFASNTTKKDETRYELFNARVLIVQRATGAAAADAVKWFFGSDTTMNAAKKIIAVQLFVADYKTGTKFTMEINNVEQLVPFVAPFIMSPQGAVAMRQDSASVSMFEMMTGPQGAKLFTFNFVAPYAVDDFDTNLSPDLRLYLRKLKELKSGVMLHNVAQWAADTYRQYQFVISAKGLTAPSVTTTGSQLVVSEYQVALAIGGQTMVERAMEKFAMILPDPPTHATVLSAIEDLNKTMTALKLDSSVMGDMISGVQAAYKSSRKIGVAVVDAYDLLADVPNEGVLIIKHFLEAFIAMSPYLVGVAVNTGAAALLGSTKVLQITEGLALAPVIRAGTAAAMGLSMGALGIAQHMMYRNLAMTHLLSLGVFVLQTVPVWRAQVNKLIADESGGGGGGGGSPRPPPSAPPASSSCFSCCRRGATCAGCSCSRSAAAAANTSATNAGIARFNATARAAAAAAPPPSAFAVVDEPVVGPVAPPPPQRVLPGSAPLSTLPPNATAAGAAAGVVSPATAAGVGFLSRLSTASPAAFEGVGFRSGGGRHRSRKQQKIQHRTRRLRIQKKHRKTHHKRRVTRRK